MLRRRAALHRSSDSTIDTSDRSSSLSCRESRLSQGPHGGTPAWRGASHRLGRYDFEENGTMKATVNVFWLFRPASPLVK